MFDDVHQRTPVPGLRWAIKRSLTEYVSALPDGRVRITGGADVVDGYHFFFPVDDALVADRPPVHRFRGTVEVTAHFGTLAFAFADPWLEGAAARRTISAATRDGSRLPLATCSLSAAAGRAIVGADVQLTVEGAAFLGGAYEPGTPLDPFTVNPRLHRPRLHRPPAAHEEPSP